MRETLAGLFLAAAALPAYPHGGGLNAEGCHNNRKTGDYHCHRAPAVERAAPQRGPARPPAEPGGRRAAGEGSPDRPTCYVGPRGGTYTITPSGRKNYSGC